MQYREIVAVTGLGGLFHLLSTKSDGAIVRSLADNATKFIPSRLHNVTPLESIEIYTTGANVRLHEVLQQMKDSAEEMPNAKKASEKDIRGYFAKVYPTMDEERVYTSDMKKMIKWFEILRGADLLDFSVYNQPQAEAEAGTEGEVGMAEAETQLAEHEKAGDTDAELVEDAEKPAKKSRAKKAAAAEGEEEGADKPAKKTAAKKKAEPAAEGEEAPKKARASKKKEGEE